MKVKVKMEVLNASHRIVDGYGIVDAELLEGCKHEYRLLELGAMTFDDRRAHKFYCVKCLQIEYK